MDPVSAAHEGGRWNPPGSFGVLYLNLGEDVARANVARLFAGLPYGPEDLDPDTAPMLVEVGELGVVCLSAAFGAESGRELAWFASPGRTRLAVKARRPFNNWFWR